MRTLARRERRQERSRTFLQNVWRATPARRRCARKASAILVCNEETRHVLAPWAAKIVGFPVNGIRREDIDGPGPGPSGRRVSACFTSAGSMPSRDCRWLSRPCASSAICPSVTLELVGEGPERPRLEALAARLGITDRIVWTPWSTRSEIFARMRRSDVFLFPSLRDGGGAVVVEAMASGLPVVCLDVAGPGFHVRERWGIKVSFRPPGRRRGRAGRRHRPVLVRPGTEGPHGPRGP